MSEGTTHGVPDAQFNMLDITIDEMGRVAQTSELQACVDEVSHGPVSPWDPQWQPITTAPRMGQHILLWWPAVSRVPFVGYFGFLDWRSATGDFWEDRPGPTHWKPQAV